MHSMQAQQVCADFKKRTKPSKKIDIYSDSFPTETVCNMQFKWSDKINFTCIRRADKNDL